MLYHNLNPPSAHDNPHDVSDERLSLDVDALLVSQSYEEHGPPQQARDSPDGLTFDVEKRHSTVGEGLEEEEEEGLTIRDIGESPAHGMKREEGEGVVSPSDVTVVLQRQTPERTVEVEEDRAEESSNGPLRTANSLKTTEV